MNLLLIPNRKKYPDIKTKIIDLIDEESKVDDIDTLYAENQIKRQKLKFRSKNDDGYQLYKDGYEYQKHSQFPNGDFMEVIMKDDIVSKWRIHSRVDETYSAHEFHTFDDSHLHPVYHIIAISSNIVKSTITGISYMEYLICKVCTFQLIFQRILNYNGEITVSAYDRTSIIDPYIYMSHGFKYFITSNNDLIILAPDVYEATNYDHGYVPKSMRTYEASNTNCTMILIDMVNYKILMRVEIVLKCSWQDICISEVSKWLHTRKELNDIITLMTHDSKIDPSFIDKSALDLIFQY